MLDLFLALDPLKNLRNFIGTFRRDQDGNRAALDFLGRIAKNPLGTRVPAQNDAVQCHANDGVMGGLHNRCQLGMCCPKLLVLAHFTIETVNNAVKERGATERTRSWLVFIRIGHCQPFKNLKYQKRYSASVRPSKRRGLGYSPRDPHAVNHRIGARCARAASKPFPFDPPGSWGLAPVEFCCKVDR